MQRVMLEGAGCQDRAVDLFACPLLSGNKAQEPSGSAELGCHALGELQMESANWACLLSSWIKSTMRGIKDGTARPRFFLACL